MNETKSKKEGKLMNGRSRKKKKVEWSIENSRRKWKTKWTNGSAEKQKDDLMNESTRKKEKWWMNENAKKREKRSMIESGRKNRKKECLKMQERKLSAKNVTNYFSSWTWNLKWDWKWIQNHSKLKFNLHCIKYEKKTGKNYVNIQDFLQPV